LETIENVTRRINPNVKKIRAMKKFFALNSKRRSKLAATIHWMNAKPRKKYFAK
jgi:hypothetical protein